MCATHHPQVTRQAAKRATDLIKAENMATVSNMIVKVTHHHEIRRFTLGATSINWPTLTKRVSELYNISKPTFTYVDDEGDRITLSSEEELLEAVALARTATPGEAASPVLRLTVITPGVESKATAADVEMNDASTDPVSKTPKSTATNTDSSNAHGNPGVPSDEYQALFQNLRTALPGLMSQLPEAVRRLVPQAELDVAATVAANAAANASCPGVEAAMAQAASAMQAAAREIPMPDGFASQSGAHPGVRCDRTGMSPIIGNRYNLVGHNYDLCEAAFQQLSDKEKELYVKIPPPPTPPVHDMAGRGEQPPGQGTATSDPHQAGVHPGVECDKSGQCPIRGIRYHLKGHNYDLCQSEFDKLPTTEKLLYTPLPPPAHAQDPSKPWNYGRFGGGPCGGGFGGGFGGFGSGFGGGVARRRLPRRPRA